MKGRTKHEAWRNERTRRATNRQLARLKRLSAAEGIAEHSGGFFELGWPGRRNAERAEAICLSWFAIAHRKI